MVFPNDRAILAFNAFAGHAGTHHFRQAVNINRVNTGPGFNVAAHGFGPWLSAKNTHFQRACRWVKPLAGKLFDDHLHVAGRDHDQLGLEVLNQLHLFFCLAARHRDHRATGALGTVVRTQAAGEQAVAVGNVNHVPRSATGSTN